MNITYLKTFLIVCESGNFTEAANKLFIPQPTVSNRISYLEEELKQDLFIKKERGKRSVSLTKAGEKLLPYAQQIIDTVNLVNEELNSTSHKKVIKIGSTIPLTHPLIFNKIGSIYSTDENTKVQVSFMENSNITSDMNHHQIDLAFVTEPIHNNYIKSLPLAGEEYELILSTKHRMADINELESIQSINNENIIILDGHSFSSKITNEVRRKSKQQLETNQIDLVKKIVSENKGLAILPSVYFEKEIEDGEIINIPISKHLGFDTIQYYLVYNKNHMEYKDIIEQNNQEIRV